MIVVDPLANHLKGASIFNDAQVRTLFEPYVGWVQGRGIVLVLNVHLLRSVNPKGSPLLAIPSGVASIAKAVYLFGDDPSLGADPNMSVLACADKYNFGAIPASLRFEYATAQVRVQTATGAHRDVEYGKWIDRGESPITGKMLLVTLAPETRDRKSDRVAYALIEMLKHGERLVAEVQVAIAALDPPVGWRTAQRTKSEMGIVERDDPSDKRRKFWSLPPEMADTLAEVTGPEDEVVIEEIDLPNPIFPDTIPEDWDGQDS